MSLAINDVLAVHELIARYGHSIDRKVFEELATVFTEDATFDASDFGRPARRGINQIIDLMTHERHHPLAHHTTDTALEAVSNTTARVRSRGLAVLHDGTVRSLLYDDLAIRTPVGWRLSERTATAIRPQ